MEKYIEKYAIPGSIIIAGLLIGTGLMLSGGIGATNQLAANTNSNPSGAPTAPAEPQELDFAPVGESDHVRGDANATVTLIEYSDLECPYCQSLHPTLQQIVDDYDGEVRWVYRHFPLEAIHPNARPAAEASECVAELGGENAFWAFVDAIFADQQGALADVRATALATGVNGSAFDSCMDSGRYSDVVDAHLEEGASVGVQGTPHTLIVGPDGLATPLVGAQPAGAFTTVIDELLK